MIEFVEFPKIARLNREIVVTEKIDGTNAQIFIRPESDGGFEFGTDTHVDLPDGSQGFIRAGSRTRWISTQDDNFGFAQWVHQRRFRGDRRVRWRSCDAHRRLDRAKLITTAPRRADGRRNTFPAGERGPA